MIYWLAVIGCLCLGVVWGYRRLKREGEWDRVPLTNARRANFLDTEARRQD